MTTTESVLLVPAREVSPLVDEFRLRYDPSARPGVPPHITILFPFVSPDRLSDALYSDLDNLLGGTSAFDYDLVGFGEFEHGVLYLAPEPSTPFIELTTIVSDHFNLKPFDGQYTSVIPHLTVTQLAGATEREAIRSRLTGRLPRGARASEAWLMVGSNDSTWATVHVTRFLGSA